MSLSLAGRGFLVNAVDNASAMVEAARLQVKRAGLESRVCVSVDDVHKLSFPTDSFNLVVGLEVVPWLHDLGKALTELWRVLKPGGYVVLSVDNSSCTRLEWWLDLQVALQSEVRRGLEKIRLIRPKGMKSAARSYVYSIDEFHRCLREAGFETVKYVGFGFGPFTFFGKDVSPSAGVSVHLKLQQYSEGRFRVLGRFAAQSVFLAIKRTRATS